jgi:hypothetical protein
MKVCPKLSSRALAVTAVAFTLAAALPLYAEKPDVRAKIIVPSGISAGAKATLVVELTLARQQPYSVRELSDPDQPFSHHVGRHALARPLPPASGTTILVFRKAAAGLRGNGSLRDGSRAVAGGGRHGSDSRDSLVPGVQQPAVLCARKDPFGREHRDREEHERVSEVNGS